MGDKERIGPESVEAGLRAVFGSKASEPESVLEALGMDSVLLRDAPDDASPILKVRPNGREAVDDRRYQVLGEIARGGVGVIFKGRDKDLARDVALKVLRTEHAENPDVVERFIEEAQIGGQLQHPGIVPVYGLGIQPDGRPYFAMKLVKGRTLSAILSERKDATENRRRLLGIFEQVCLTMAYAHARAVIHRDLKPSNVMVGAFGEVQVVDWGFAKVLGTGERARQPRKPDQTIVATVRSGEGSSHSIAGSVMGTPAYMPPEQAMGLVDDLDERADVFALGAILCEILSGKPPYVGEAADLFMMATQAKLDGAKERLASCGAEEELVDIAKHCLGPVASERPRDAGAVAGAIHGQLAAVEERARKMELAAAEARAREQEQHARLATQEARAKQEEARVAKGKRQAAKQRARQKDERQRAAFERKARTRTVAAAAALLVAVLVGVGGLLRSQGEAAAQARAIEAKVSAALQKAGELEGKQKWSEALAAAEGASNLAQDADPGTLERARRTVARIGQKQRDAAAAAERLARDRKLLAALDRAASVYDAMAADAGYERVLREHGIDLGRPADAARRIRGSTVSGEITAHLDRWAALRRTSARLAGKDWRVLVRIGEEADPDPVRNRLRDAGANEDLEELKRIATEIEGKQAPLLTRVLLAAELFTSGDHAAGTKLLHKLYRSHPDSFYVNRGFGGRALIVEASEREELVRHATAAAALRPKDRLLELKRALVAGEYDAGLRLCEELLKEDPENEDVLYYRALLLSGKGDARGAVAAYRRVIEVNPQADYAWTSLSTALADEKVRDLKGALDAAREAERIAGTAYARAGSLNNQALYSWSNGDTEQALEKAREAARLLPRWERIHVTYGFLLAKAGHTKEAVGAYRRSLEIEPTAASHGGLGVVLQRTGDPGTALEHFKKAVELGPNNGFLHVGLASFYRDRSHPDRAIAAVSPALRIQVDHPAKAGAWALLADSHRIKGEGGLCDRSLTEAFQADPENVSAHMVQGARFQDRGMHDRAAASYERAARLQETWPRQVTLIDDAPTVPYAYLGHSLMRLGRFDEALAALSKYRPNQDQNFAGRDLRAWAAKLMADCERILPFAGREREILAGEVEPGTRADALAFATMCQFRNQHQRAAELYRAAGPRESRDRVRAALSAAQGGPEWRTQAWQWLRAEFTALKGETEVVAVRKRLWEWKRHPLLAPVRDPIPLAKLPDAERAHWVPFWKDVDALLARALEGD